LTQGSTLPQADSPASIGSISNIAGMDGMRGM
jgi:hypothetical protein